MKETVTVTTGVIHRLSPVNRIHVTRLNMEIIWQGRLKQGHPNTGETCNNGKQTSQDFPEIMS